MEHMTDEELSRAIDGLFAYDNGAIDSGVHDPELKARVRSELAVGRGEYQLISPRVSRIVRELYLSDEAIAQGYGLEDAARCFQWIDDGLQA